MTIVFRDCWKSCERMAGIWTERFPHCGPIPADAAKPGTICPLRFAAAAPPLNELRRTPGRRRSGPPREPGRPKCCGNPGHSNKRRLQAADSWHWGAHDRATLVALHEPVPRGLRLRSASRSAATRRRRPQFGPVARPRRPWHPIRPGRGIAKGEIKSDKHTPACVEFVRDQADEAPLSVVAGTRILGFEYPTRCRRRRGRQPTKLRPWWASQDSA